MIDRLALLTSSATRAADGRLRDLADQLGIASDLVPCDLGPADPDLGSGPGGPVTAGAVSGRTLGLMIQAGERLGQRLPPVLERFRHLLVYDLTPDPLCDLALRRLTSEALSSVSRFATADLRYEIAPGQPEIVGELGGARFGPIDPRTDFWFDGPRPESAGDTLIAIDGRPFLLQIVGPARRTFLAAGGAVVDIRQALAPDFLIRDHFSALVPYVMFLKQAFGDNCWHAAKKHACFIIDDPLLKRTYGALDFHRFTRLMEAKRFKTALAFIPWNYRRTGRTGARYFRDHQDVWSLCVHGNDHTAGEFAAGDVGELTRSVATATARMDRHQQRTGLAYDKVLVFPQGLFSGAALEALNSQAYLAAANSSLQPRDGGEVRISDYLELAMSRIGGVPVFLRRYPREMPDVLIGLFLGKPALLVEHQEYFRDKTDDQVAAFADEIRERCPGVAWASLGEIVRGSCLVRRIDEETWECRIYAHEALVKNDADRPRTFRVVKNGEDRARIREVFVNGEPVAYDLSEGRLTIALLLGAGESASIRISHVPPENLEPAARRWTYEARVLGRRVLSEFRDEVLSRHERWLALAKKVLSMRQKKGRTDGRRRDER
jgi:hypothetical protein